MVPAAVLVLLHTPPEVVLLNVIVLASQTFAEPVMAAGVRFTVIVVVV
jgi:hypothetical protein